MTIAYILGARVIIGPDIFPFTSHPAAFEAYKRLNEREWSPIGGGSYFRRGDPDIFQIMLDRHPQPHGLAGV
jgi:hypothetical protein